MNTSEESPKQPPIRKGQRKPYTKATCKQVDLRVEAADLLRFCRFTKSEIHRIFRKRYGVEWRQTDRYMARARARTNSALSPGFQPSDDNEAFDATD